MSLRGLASIPIAVLALLAPAAQATFFSFGGTNVGLIPDGDPNGRTISFAVSGITVPIASVRVVVGINHPYAGDLTATLIAPGGVARLVLFGRPGAGLTDQFGDGTDLNGVYTFTDTGFPDLIPRLLSLNDSQVLASDSFKPVSRNAPLRSNNGGCPTSLRGVFGGLPPSAVNGTWTLVVSDSAAAFSGSVTSATLILDTSVLFANGFEAAGGGASAAAADGSIPPAPTEAPMAPLGIEPPAHCYAKVFADFTGDGLSDYALVRNVGGTWTWLIRENLRDGNASTTVTQFDFGSQSNGDLVDHADFDGDRISDPVVWRPGPQGTARFSTRLSSRNGAVREFVFGQFNDDVHNLGDYDGDAIDDVAVFREPDFSAPPGPNRVIWQSSRTGAVTTVNVGTGARDTYYSVSGYDYNADGYADVAAQTADPMNPSLGRFRFYDAWTNGMFDFYTFGQSNDFFVPGNYVGTPRIDMTVSRTFGGDRQWDTRDGQSGAVEPTIVFGVGGDLRVVGDYDGDGRNDHAFFRASSSPGASAFQVRPSLNPASPWTVFFGAAGDISVATSRVK